MSQIGVTQKTRLLLAHATGVHAAKTNVLFEGCKLTFPSTDSAPPLKAGITLETAYCNWLHSEKDVAVHPLAHDYTMGSKSDEQKATANGS